MVRCLFFRSGFVGGGGGDWEKRNRYGVRHEEKGKDPDGADVVASWWCSRKSQERWRGYEMSLDTGKVGEQREESTRSHHVTCSRCVVVFD